MSTKAAAATKPPKSRGPTASLAAAVIDGSSETDLAGYAADLTSDNKSAATRAARIFEEVVAQAPTLAAPHIAKLVALLSSDANPRAVQAAAQCLPKVAAVAPAKVARHIDRMRQGYERCGNSGREGVVLTLAALCDASVAYQKRVVDVFERALAEAEPKLLVSWSEAVLPVLKGEPYATARAVVEQRMPDLPRPQAQKLADFLGVRLRLARG
ncbi:MAG: hypothetical protein OEZ06_07920 [Myxococcales bacterium]|nr:hypothetical protein [Myxococcales bacterium]